MILPVLGRAILTPMAVTITAERYWKRKRDIKQRRWERKKLTAGLCMRCGRRPLLSERACKKCLKRDRARKAAGADTVVVKLPAKFGQASRRRA